jgi:hypothetical protein
VSERRDLPPFVGDPIVDLERMDTETAARWAALPAAEQALIVAEREHDRRLAAARRAGIAVGLGG